MTTGINAPERAIYHEWIEKFKEYLKPNDRVYDIGCFARHDYHETMKDYNYRTVDRNKAQNPDIICDIEKLPFEHECKYIDALMCHGVHSECGNPEILTNSCRRIVKSGGVILFGIVLLGYPTYEGELWRFTEKGAKALLKDFSIIEDQIVMRETPSFYFAIVRK